MDEADVINVLDFWGVIKEINGEFERAGWTLQEIKDYVWLFYKVKSRIHLTDEQLLELLEFSKNLPSLPNNSKFRIKPLRIKSLRNNKS